MKMDTPAAQYDRAETEKLLNSPTAKPRKYWVTEVQWAANHIALPLCKRHDLPFMFPVLVFPLSAAAHEERVEQVAKELALNIYGLPENYMKDHEMTEAQVTKFCRELATAALAAISKEL